MTGIRNHFAEVSGALGVMDTHEIEKAIALLEHARGWNAMVWIVGNGGSAATAEHFANDLVKMCGLRAVALPALVPTVTAYGNDDGWQDMFAHALDVMQEPEDVLVAISCSGNSPNVVNAARGVEKLVILTGNDPGSELVKLRAVAVMSVPSDDITVVEDAHLAVCHAIAKGLRR